MEALPHLNMTPVKQMFSAQKSFFENVYTSNCRLQDQAEKWMESLFKQMPYLPEEGKKMYDETLVIGKKTRDHFKKTMDDAFMKMEALLAGK